MLSPPITKKLRAANVRTVESLLRNTKPQMSLGLTHSSDYFGVGLFVDALRLVRRVDLTREIVFNGASVVGLLSKDTSGGYYIQIKRSLSIQEQVLTFLHEIGHICIFEGLLQFPSYILETEILSQSEILAELFSAEFFHQQDVFAYEAFLWTTWGYRYVS